MVGLAHPGLDPGPQPLREMIFDVADLVQLALDHWVVEHVEHGAAQRLRPVQHGQDWAGHVQAPLARALGHPNHGTPWALLSSPHTP